MDISNFKRNGNKIDFGEGYTAITEYKDNTDILKIYYNNRIIGDYFGSSLILSEPLTDDDKGYLMTLLTESMERMNASINDSVSPMESLLNEMKDAFIRAATGPYLIYVYFDKDTKKSRSSPDNLIYPGEILITTYSDYYENELSEEELEEMGLSEEDALEIDWDEDIYEQAQNIIQSLIDRGILDQNDFQCD